MKKLILAIGALLFIIVSNASTKPATYSCPDYNSLGTENCPYWYIDNVEGTPMGEEGWEHYIYYTWYLNHPNFVITEDWVCQRFSKSGNTEQMATFAFYSPYSFPLMGYYMAVYAEQCD